ncbi:MAG: hypothetical protein HN350_15445 [Phycisphaerales bacterium]|jgi:hypothetical protein|nr:hypothetical protein [Phycisphaerales bacterium]
MSVPMAVQTDQDIVSTIASMRRSQLVSLLRRMHCGFEIDFSDEYVNSMNLDRLRHIALAASLHDKTFAA